MKIRRAVGAFIKNKDGKYLIAKNTKIIVRNGVEAHREEFWDIPRGGVEEGENELEALRRELREELGTDKFRNIRKLDLNFSFELHPEVKKEIGFDHQNVELFFAEFYGDEGEIKPDGKEITDFMFLDEKNLLKKLKFENSKRAFKSLLKLRSKKV